MMRATNSYLAATLLGLAAILTLACQDSISPPTPTTGTIEITVSTTGASVDIDPDGYAVRIDGGLAQAVAVSGAVTIGGLPSGTHLVRLDGVAPNCSVDGANPRSVEVIAGESASLLSFAVSCVATGAGGGDWDY